MRLLVTVGTTPFYGLFSYFEHEIFSDVDIVFQTAMNRSIYGIKCFSFLENIENEYDKADIVVTHAGAGSVYQLLENDKNIIVVPNMERHDKHQIEMAKFVEYHRLGLVAWRFENIKKYVYEYKYFKKNKYNKDRFFKGDEIYNIMVSHL